jgi:hypothetical protein
VADFANGTANSDAHALDELHDRFQHWFGDDYDLDAIDAVLTVSAVEKFDDGSDPLWLLVVGGPGGCKTETVMPLIGCGAVIVSTISSTAALLSGTPKRERTKDATGGLLRRRGPDGLIVFKDVTSILSLNPGIRGEIMAALREIYDGCWSREVGVDGGRVLEWTGRIGVVGAVTTAWDRAHAAVASMGDRFVLVRMDSTQHRVASGERAIANTGGEKDMRQELSELVAKVIDGAPKAATQLAVDERELILGAADLVTRARTAVDFDYRGDVIDCHALEAPTRFAKQLAQIVRGGIAIGLSRKASLRLAIRCARDSMPPMRLAIIDDLAEYPYSTPTEVRKRLDKPRATVDRQMQALHTLGVLTPEEVQAKERKTWHYTLAEGIDPANLLVPDLSLHKEKREEEGYDSTDTDISGTKGDEGLRRPGSPSLSMALQSPSNDQNLWMSLGEAA